MRRALLFYFSFLGSSGVLFAVALTLSVTFGGSVVVGLVRFIVMAAAFGCAVGTWATAVMIASVHKVGWPLTLSTALVVTSCLFLGASWFGHVF